MEQYNDLILLITLIITGASGNVFYRLNNHLKIKPFFARILAGVMAATIYILFFFFVLHEKPKFEILKLIGGFAVGYFTETILEILQNKFPQLFDRFLGGGKHENDN